MDSMAMLNSQRVTDAGQLETDGDEITRRDYITLE